MACIGCAVTMEHAFARVAEHATTLGNRLSLTEQETHTLDLGDVLADADRTPWPTHSPAIPTVWEGVEEPLSTPVPSGGAQ